MSEKLEISVESFVIVEDLVHPIPGLAPVCGRVTEINGEKAKLVISPRVASALGLGSNVIERTLGELTSCSKIPRAQLNEIYAPR